MEGKQKSGVRADEGGEAGQEADPRLAELQEGTLKC